VTPQGEPYRNLCIGCDRFHEEVLGAVLASARERRRAMRAVASAPPPSVSPLPASAT